MAPPSVTAVLLVKVVEATVSVPVCRARPPEVADAVLPVKVPPERFTVVEAKLLFDIVIPPPWFIAILLVNVEFVSVKVPTRPLVMKSDAS
jgi:hypothetical protein